MGLRPAGRMHHLGIGGIHTGKRVLAITNDTTVTVIELDTGEVLSGTRSSPREPPGATNNEAQADRPRRTKQLISRLTRRP